MHSLRHVCVALSHTRRGDEALRVLPRVVAVPVRNPKINYGADGHSIGRSSS